MQNHSFITRSAVKLNNCLNFLTYIFYYIRYLNNFKMFECAYQRTLTKNPPNKNETDGEVLFGKAVDITTQWQGPSDTDHLHLHHQNVHSLEDGGFSSLQRLTVVDVSRNQIAFIGSLAFQGKFQTVLCLKSWKISGSTV